ncbi:hypothetical protein ES703_83682 [subsurface metagenome]
MTGHKRKLIEARLSQSLESFLTKRIAAGQALKNIARELDLDPATIRYYLKKYKIPHGLGKPRQPLSPYTKDTKAPKLRLKGEHVDVCLCPLCGKNCEAEERIHQVGRCVLFCANFSRKVSREDLIQE